MEVPILPIRRAVQHNICLEIIKRLYNYILTQRIATATIYYY